MSIYIIYLYIGNRSNIYTIDFKKNKPNADNEF